jgi:hypothetical protein
MLMFAKDENGVKQCLSLSIGRRNRGLIGRNIHGAAAESFLFLRSSSVLFLAAG